MNVLLNDQRYDCVIIWGHGLCYTDEILELIRNVENFEIVRIIKYRPKNIKQFVKKVYSYDYAPISHLKSKIKYLDNVKAEVLCIVINNLCPKVDILGTGAFRHEESIKLKKLKTQIRKKYNPYIKGEMTHDHVIHATDNGEQTFHILNAIGEVSADFTNRNNLFMVPHFLGNQKFYNIKELSFTELVCRQLMNSGGIDENVNVIDSVQYKALIGDIEIYQQYVSKHLGEGLKCDYNLTKFLLLSKSFLYLAKGYESSYVIVKKNETDTYSIVDGLHRAAIHLHQGNNKIKVCII
jgi:hypothetical protein